MKVCVIPARGGSKRIPRKNIKPFHGRPMIEWSIRAAQAAGCFDRIVTTTDDTEIAEVARAAGAEVPFLRDASLADDYATTAAVMRDACARLELGAEDAVCCLYPTAPLIRGEDLSGALAQLEDSRADFVLSIGQFPYPIQRALHLNDAGQIRMAQPEHATTRSQDLEAFWHDAGQFYWGTGASWQSGTETVFGPRTSGYPIPPGHICDIDTPDDWSEAELRMALLKQEK